MWLDTDLDYNSYKPAIYVDTIFSIIPRRCKYTKKWLWLQKTIKIRTYTYYDDLYTPNEYADPKEYVKQLLKC